MKSTLDQLSEKERKALALWYGTETHKAFEKLLRIDGLELAKDHVGVSDINLIRFLSGQAYALDALLKVLKENYKKNIKL